MNDLSQFKHQQPIKFIEESIISASLRGDDHLAFTLMKNRVLNTYDQKRSELNRLQMEMRKLHKSSNQDEIEYLTYRIDKLQTEFLRHRNAL